MIALTLSQPWASLVAHGDKRIETRSWSTPYRGLLAIHAATGVPRWARDLASDEPFHEALAARGVHRVTDLPRGAVIAVCRLATCVPTEQANGPLLTPRERAFGDFRPGRWAWALADVIALPEPVPAVGHLGLWEWEAPPAVLELVNAEGNPR